MFLFANSLMNGSGFMQSSGGMTPFALMPFFASICAAIDAGTPTATWPAVHLQSLFERKIESIV